MGVLLLYEEEKDSYVCLNGSVIYIGESRQIVFSGYLCHYFAYLLHCQTPTDGLVRNDFVVVTYGHRYQLCCIYETFGTP